MGASECSLHLCYLPEPVISEIRKMLLCTLCQDRAMCGCLDKAMRSDADGCDGHLRSCFGPSHVSIQRKAGKMAPPGAVPQAGATCLANGFGGDFAGSEGRGTP